MSKGRRIVQATSPFANCQLFLLSQIVPVGREEARRRDFAWVKGEVGIEERAQQYGHRAAIVLVTGGRHTGKSFLAKTLEARLVADGRHAYLLDGENLRRGSRYSSTVKVLVADGEKDTDKFALAGNGHTIVGA